MPVRHSYLLVNSRYFRLDPVILNMEELSQLIEYELTQRLRLINEICVTYVDEFPQALYEYNLMGSGLDDMDWFDLVSSIVTKSFHVDDKTFVNDVNRYDFGSLDMSNLIDYKKHDESKQVDVLVIMDPLEDNSQKLINILDAVKDFFFCEREGFISAKARIRTRRVDRTVLSRRFPSFYSIF